MYEGSCVGDRKLVGDLLPKTSFKGINLTVTYRYYRRKEFTIVRQIPMLKQI